MNAQQFFTPIYVKVSLTEKDDERSNFTSKLSITNGILGAMIKKVTNNSCGNEWPVILSSSLAAPRIIYKLIDVYILIRLQKVMLYDFDLR